MELARELGPVGVGLLCDHRFGGRRRSVDLGTGHQRPRGGGFGGGDLEQRNRGLVELEIVSIAVVVEESVLEFDFGWGLFGERQVEGFLLADQEMVAAAETAVGHAMEDRDRDLGAALGAPHLDGIA